MKKKKIYFNNEASVTTISILMVAGLAIIGLNFVKDISPKELYAYKVSAYLLVIAIFVKKIIENLWLKNFIGWTKRILHLKINSRQIETIHRSDIKKVEFNSGILTIKTSGKNFVYDLEPYRNQDVQKLLKIIRP